MKDFPHNVTETDIIALHLRELSLLRESEVLDAIESNAELAAESAAVASLLLTFKQIPPVRVDSAVVTRNWNALRSALRAPALPVFSRVRWKMPAWYAVGATAALAAAGIFVARHHSEQVHAPVVAVQHEAVQSAPALLSQKSASAANKIRMKSGGEELRASMPAQTLRDLVPLSMDNEMPAPQPSFAQISTMVAPEFPAFAAMPPLEMQTVSPSPAAPVSGNNAAPNSGQSVESTSKATQTRRVRGVRHKPTDDFMLAAGGFWGLRSTENETSGSGTSESTMINSEGVQDAVIALGAFHQQFRPALGYSLAVSYSRPTFAYNSENVTEGTTYGTMYIQNRVNELEATYVAQGPRSRRWRTSLDAGIGVMGIFPSGMGAKNYFSTGYGPENRVYRAAGIAGVSVDFAVIEHWSIRGGYRAQMYKAPDFREPLGGNPIVSRITMTSQPYLGIVYSFGGGKER